MPKPRSRGVLAPIRFDTGRDGPAPCFDMTPKFFDPWAEIRHTANFLPHWQQPGATYFVTFRLADAIPAALRSQLETERAAWLRQHPRPWNAQTERDYHGRFSGAVERWLDAGHGACALRDPAAAQVVANALGFFDAQRHCHHAWVVMPNHVHALFSLHPEWSLEKVLHSWKSFTAHELAKRGVPTPLWQEDYFDRLVRDEKHYANCVRYIRRNPQKAHLKTGEFILFESALAQGIE